MHGQKCEGDGVGESGRRNTEDVDESLGHFSNTGQQKIRLRIKPVRMS